MIHVCVYMRESYMECVEKVIAVDGRDCDGALQQGSTERYGSDGERAVPLAHVLFFNNVKSCNMRHKLEECIIQLCGLNSEPELRHELICHNESADLTGSVTYYDTFCVDSLGQPMQATPTGEDMELPLSVRVIYDQVYMEPFWVSAVTEQEERRLRRMAIKCFNCGDYHHLDDCPMPKDAERIFQERQSFRANFGPAGADTRYHLSSSTKQHSEFCPGQISDNLRRALNLSPADYPPYIRRMMIHGYPPGYRLLEAESYITMIDDATMEEGSNAQVHRGLEIIYPGFNDRRHAEALGLKIIPVAKVTVDSKFTSLDEELGSSYDYEFEECELEDGEQIVELRVKQKQLNNSTKQCFSLDFPPGLVHLEEGQSTPGQTWTAIKTLLANKKKTRLK